jgi:hypothetical protein
MSDGSTVEVDPAPIEPHEVLVVRRGPGANCSSIGSVLDMLFLSAVAGGALLVGVAAALSERREPAPEPARELEPSPPEGDARPR